MDGAAARLGNGYRARALTFSAACCCLTVNLCYLLCTDCACSYARPDASAPKRTHPPSSCPDAMPTRPYPPPWHDRYLRPFSGTGPCPASAFHSPPQKEGRMAVLRGSGHAQLVVAVLRDVPYPGQRLVPALLDDLEVAHLDA